MYHTLLWWSSLAALGLGVGVIAGMFGVGGGFLLTPLLILIFRVRPDIAVGTGLCQMIGVAVAALLRHMRLKQGELKIDWIMMAGSLLGVGLGARTVTFLDALGTLHWHGRAIPAAKFWLSVGYIVLLGGVASWVARDAKRPARTGTAPAPPGPLVRLRWPPPLTQLPRAGHRVSAPLLAYLGLGLGFLSGLLGIGGGVALMPLLVYGIGMRMRVAAGTGILMLLATSLVGTAVHARLGHVNLTMAVTLLVGSTLGAQVGAVLTSRMDGQRLRGVFAILVACTALAVAWDLAETVLG